MIETELIRVELHDDQQTVFIAPEAINETGLAFQLAETIEKSCQGAAFSVLCIDLKNIPWIGSSGLNHLIRIHRKVHGLGGQVLLSNVGDRVRETLRLTRLERMFELESHDSESESSFHTSEIA